MTETPRTTATVLLLGCTLAALIIAIDLAAVAPDLIAFRYCAETTAIAAAVFGLSIRRSGKAGRQ